MTQFLYNKTNDITKYMILFTTRKHLNSVSQKSTQST